MVAVAVVLVLLPLLRPPPSRHACAESCARKESAPVEQCSAHLVVACTALAGSRARSVALLQPLRCCASRSRMPSRMLRSATASTRPTTAPATSPKRSAALSSPCCLCHASRCCRRRPSAFLGLGLGLGSGLGVGLGLGLGLG